MNPCFSQGLRTGIADCVARYRSGDTKNHFRCCDGDLTVTGCALMQLVRDCEALLIKVGCVSVECRKNLAAVAIT